ncbi:MAG TPA: DNA-3-methyladenine glycosylase 2 family protein [Firmicutes bacterium]|jgi:N-glycosylase/DNA lyase|nr:DNA-3-methyladenine glycosylase 2 family protein [Bacillota bacterium]
MCAPEPGRHAAPQQSGSDMELSEIELPGPLDLQSTLECGQAFRWKQVAGPGARTWYKGVIGPAGVMVTTGGDSRLLVLYEAGTVDRERLTKDISNYFSLDDDLEAIHRFLLDEACSTSLPGQQPVLHQAIRYARGLRILRQEPWECLVSYIISANKNIPAICKTVEYLSDTLGSPAGLGQYSFPSPEALLEASIECVKQSKCGYRAPYIIDAASKVAGKHVDLDALWHLPTGEARQQLLTIKGVGPKVADCVLLFGYHRLDVFPVDVWIARCMSAFYLGRAHITPKQARDEGCKRFGPYAGYAQQILFHYSRNVLKGRV